MFLDEKWLKNKFLDPESLTMIFWSSKPSWVIKKDNRQITCHLPKRVMRRPPSFFF